MTDITINKDNFGDLIQVLNKLINKKDKTIRVSYKEIKNDQKTKSDFLSSLKNDPIKFNGSPLSFQKKLRDEWE